MNKAKGPDFTSV